MAKSRYTDSEILAILKQAEAGTPVPELCCEYGMSSASFYKWQAKYCDMDPALMAKRNELNHHFKDPDDWYPILQQAMLKGDDTQSVLVPNDFSLFALDQLLQAAEEVGIRLKPLSLNVATAIGTHLWFGEGEYPLIIIGCDQGKVDVCIAAASDYKEKNARGEIYSERFLEVLSCTRDLDKHELVSQLETLFKALGLNAKDIKCSFVYGEVAFLHEQLEGYFTHTPLDQTQMKGYVPANAGLECMNAILNGEKMNYVLIDISPHSLTLFAHYSGDEQKKLLTVPESLDFTLVLPMTIQLFFLLKNQKFWSIQSLQELSPDSQPPYAFPYDSHPTCALPYDSDNPPTKLVVMQNTANGKLIPYKEFEITKLQNNEVINMTLDYNTNGQIQITTNLIKLPT